MFGKILGGTFILSIMSKKHRQINFHLIGKLHTAAGSASTSTSSSAWTGLTKGWLQLVCPKAFLRTKKKIMLNPWLHA